MTMMKKIVAAAVIGSTALATFGSAAQAGDWRGRGYGPGYGGPAYDYRAPAPQPYYGGYNHQRRDRTGEKIATGVAIGVGALILGSILANEARRNQGYQGY